MFLMAQKKRPNALNATQKTAALCKVRFLKKLKKKLIKYPFLTKICQKWSFFEFFFLIFSETVPCKQLGFFVVAFSASGCFF